MATIEWPISIDPWSIMTLNPRPAPFSAFTTPEFWNDPHISEQMLVNHLDPESPLASRKHEFIDSSVEWLIPALGLVPGSRLLDLGCGPGLYSHRIAGRGIEVRGIDVSERALAYACEGARRDALPATFQRGSYLSDELGEDYDAAILIYEDYCALSPSQRATLLSRVCVALRPGGRLLFDVTSAARFADVTDAIVHEPDLMAGFWATSPYQGTHETWTYPELRLVLDRFTIETEMSTRQFWNWMHCLTPDDVAGELRAAGFVECELFGDVCGAAYSEVAPTFAVLATRS